MDNENINITGSSDLESETTKTTETTETVEVSQSVDHPFLTTNFSDYTVTEGLLLLSLVFACCVVIYKMLKRGFEKWL